MEKLNVFQKIAKVMEEVEYLQKDDRVITNSKTGDGYKALSEEKATMTVRPFLIKYGLVIIPVEQVHNRTDETVEGYNGSTRINRISTVDNVYRIQNVEDKEDYVMAVSSGTGVDTQDKGIGKAMTYAYKYLLLRTFAIPSGDDTDKISSQRYDDELYGSEEDKAKKTVKEKEITEEDIKEPGITEGQLKILNAWAKTEEIKNKMLKKLEVEKFEDLTLTKAGKFIYEVTKKKKKGGK